MPLNFPNSPSIGDEHVGINDVLYVWDGEKWKSSNNLGPSLFGISSGIPPSGASNGDAWFDTESGRAYVYYIDADSAQWIDMSPTWNGTLPSGSVYPSTLSSGGPSWTASGDLTIPGTLTVTSGDLTIPGALTVTSGLTVDTDSLYVDAANNRVGIGTTAPGTKLEIGGAITSKTSTAGLSDQSITFSESGSGNGYGVRLGHVSNTEFAFERYDFGWAETVRIDGAGRIGVGNSIPVFGSPKLHVHGTVSTNGLVNILNNSNSGDVNHGMLNLINTTTGAVGNDSRIMFTFRQTGSSSTLDPMASIGAVKESGSHSAGLTFNTRSAPGTYAERMRILSDGYISTPDNSSSASGLQIGYQKLQAITGSFSANTWYDSGIDRTTDTGIFEVDLLVDTWNGGGQSYSMRYTGWFVMHSGSTNSTDVSNIDMHRSGHAPNNETIQLRTILSPAASGGNIRLQWLSNFGLNLNNAGGSLLRIALRRYASAQ